MQNIKSMNFFKSLPKQKITKKNFKNFTAFIKNEKERKKKKKKRFEVHDAYTFLHVILIFLRIGSNKKGKLVL